MAPRKIHYSEVELKRLEGRDLRLAVTEGTIGAREMCVGIIWLKPGAVTKPCHAHLREEEVIYIVEGDGEVWVDGEKAPVRAGDFVLFPKNSKHMLRNSGNTTMQVLFIFSPPTDPSKYILYPEIDFS
ncbi:MAG: cupin domain-containing protein [Candidatus Bathyarchaeia archaeon]